MTNLAKSKALLEKKLAELTDRVEDIDDDLSEPGDDDWDEAAVESAGDEVLEEVAEVSMEEINQIKLALKRIDAGVYGKCSECGDVIPAGRLEAIPHATKCVSCA